MADFHFKLYAFLGCWVGSFAVFYASSWIVLGFEQTERTRVLVSLVLFLGTTLLTLSVVLMRHREIRKKALVKFKLGACSGFVLAILWLWLSDEWSFSLMVFMGYSAYVIVGSKTD